MAWPFIQRHFGRMVVGVILVAIVCWVTSFYASYRREQRIAARIKTRGGLVHFEPCGLSWMPQAIRTKLPLQDRITGVNVSSETVPPEMFIELGSLSNLNSLALKDAQMSDPGRKHLKQAKKLKIVHFLMAQGTLPPPRE